MCYPVRIPLPVTILYIVTVTNLAVFLNLTLVDANVRVLNKFNQTIVDSIIDLPATFGSAVPDEGVWGHLIQADPRDACSPISPPPKVGNDSGILNQWIALVERNHCNFDWKVLEAQKKGFVAVIVYNTGSDQLVPMKGTLNASKVHIPSIFIGFRDAEYLYQRCNNDIHYTVVIDNESPIIDPNTAKLIFSIFGIVIGSCFITMIVFAVVKWIRDYRKRSRSRLSKAHLKQLPVQKFKKGDLYDICAICLDEYEEGEKLRILPCNHAYHMKCIDPWLLKNKKTCPICKRKVMPSRHHSDSESDSDDSESETTNESQPLLSTGRRVGMTRGNTFNNTGVPDRLLRGYNYSSSEDEDDENMEEGASSLEDSLLPATSRYQSSVEVHSEPDYRTAQTMRPPRRMGGIVGKYAMFRDNNPAEVKDNVAPATTSTTTTTPGDNKPEPEPKQQRAWEYGLSPPKLDHFSIQNEMEDVAKEEEPVAIHMSPNSSQEESAHSGEGKNKDSDSRRPITKPKKSKKSGKKSSSGSSQDEGTSKTTSSNEMPSLGGDVNDAKQDVGRPSTSDNTRYCDDDARPGNTDVQMDGNLELQGAVGGISEDQLMEQPVVNFGQEDLEEQPIVEVISRGKRKVKKKPTKKRR